MGGGERETDRQRERERDGDRDHDTHTHAHTHREREREKERNVAVNPSGRWFQAPVPILLPPSRRAASSKSADCQCDAVTAVPLGCPVVPIVCLCVCMCVRACVLVCRPLCGLERAHGCAGVRLWVRVSRSMHALDQAFMARQAHVFMSYRCELW